MKGSGGHTSGEGPTWEQEFLEYLEGIISKRLRERAAPIAEESAIPIPPESEQAGAIEVADGGLATMAVSSGVHELDIHLGGGFFPGLWTVAGPSAAVTTAFLESVALEAATNQRPVVYYALGDSVDAIRQRFLDVVACIAADWEEHRPNRREESPYDRSLPARPDRTLQAAVLSSIWIVDAVPQSPDPVGGFLRSLEETQKRVTPEAGSPPVVLIDDRTSLLRALGVESAQGALRTAAGLDGALLRRGSPGLMAALPDLAAILPPEEEAKARGLIHLGRGHIELVSRSATRIDAIIHENIHTTWRGRVPLVLHASEGMFTSAV
jgi:hypothetical protein